MEARSPGRCSNAENAPPSTASHRPAARADPHYVVIPRDGRKLVTKVRVVDVRPRTDTHTDRQTHRRAWPQYILRRLTTHAKCITTRSWYTGLNVCGLLRFIHWRVVIHLCCTKRHRSLYRSSHRSILVRCEHSHNTTVNARPSCIWHAVRYQTTRKTCHRTL